MSRAQAESGYDETDYDETEDFEDESQYEAALPVGNAVAALMFGILAALSGPGGFLFGTVAVITGHIARRDVRRGVARGDGMAIAGLILGYLGIVATIGYTLKTVV